MEIYVIIDNTLITFVNVSEFYRIFTFRFSVQRVTKVLFLL